MSARPASPPAPGRTRPLPLPRTQIRGGAQPSQQVSTRAQLRALVWLRTHELAGGRFGAWKLRVLLGMLGGWIVLSLLAVEQGVELGAIEPATLVELASVAWVLWALVPGLGGGANEVASTQRLAPYPVGARPVFTASWATSMLDVPYLTVGPLVLGLSATIAGGTGYHHAGSLGIGALAGLVAAIAFIAGASGLGQLSAWGATWVLAGRRAPGRTALWGVGIAALALLGVRSLGGQVHTLATFTPGGWIASAARAGEAGAWGRWSGWVLLLVLPALVAPRLGGRLVGAAWGKEARSQGLPARAWGEPTWASRGSLTRVIIATQLRSILRSAAAQVALAGVLLVPVSARLAVHPSGGSSGGVALSTIGAISAVSVSLAIGCNALGYLAGGTTWLASTPLRPSTLLRSSAVAVGALVLVGQSLAIVEAWVLGDVSGNLGEALVLAGARTLALAGAAVRWSVAHPTSADFDSLRTRIASPRSVVGFLAAATMGNLLISAFTEAAARVGHPELGLVSAYVIGILLGSGWLWLGGWRLRRSGTEHLALEVRG